MTSIRGLTINDVLDTTREAIFRDLHVSLPAEVTEFDPVRGTVDLQPMIPEWWSREDGGLDVLSMCIATSCPVLWPGGGGWRIKFPLKPGDRVWLLVSDRPLEGWITAGKNVDPKMRWRHHLTDAVCIPCQVEPLDSVTPAPTDGVWIGQKDGTEVVIDSTGVKLGGQDAAEPVVLGSSFKAALDALVTALNDLCGVIVAQGGGGSPINPPLTALVTTAGSVAAAGNALKAATYLSGLVRAK